MTDKSIAQSTLDECKPFRFVNYVRIDKLEKLCKERAVVSIMDMIYKFSDGSKLVIDGYNNVKVYNPTMKMMDKR